MTGRRTGWLAIGMAMALAGCATDAARIVAQDSGSVSIQAEYGTPGDAILAQAQSACASFGRAPEPAGERCVDTYCSTRILTFACREP